MELTASRKQCLPGSFAVFKTKEFTGACQGMSWLTIEASFPAAPGDYKVEVDFCVPLTVRASGRKNDPPWHVQQTGSAKSLLEILVDPRSRAIVGITLVLAETWRKTPQARELPREHGMPIVRIPDDAVYHEPQLEGRWFANVIKINAPFTASIGPGFLEIDLGALAEATNIIENEQVEFYLNGEELVGLRIVRLNAEQIVTLTEVRDSIGSAQENDH